MFSCTVFKILLFEGWSVLGTVQEVSGNEKIKFPVKNQKNVRLLLELLEKGFSYKFRRFKMAFNFFDFV